MQRSFGVTLIGVLSLVGSVLVLAIGALVGCAMFLAPNPSIEKFPGSPVLPKVIISLVALIYVLPAIWGIFTSIGLFRLKDWARISIIVFAALLILMSGCAGLVSLAVPLPNPNSTVPPSFITSFRIFMGLFWFALMGIGIWWAVFLNRTKVKAQFVTATANGEFASQAVLPAMAVRVLGAPQVQRPVSITVIAWFLLVGCLFFPLSLMLHTPAIFFTKILTGWLAMLLYVVFIGLNLWIGLGLLRLKENARRVAIVYYAFSLVNTAVFYFAPRGSERMRAFMDMQPQIFPWARAFQNGQLVQFDPMPFVNVGAALGVVGTLVPLYFLVTRKRAFENTTTKSDSADVR